MRLANQTSWHARGTGLVVALALATTLAACEQRVVFEASGATGGTGGGSAGTSSGGTGGGGIGGVGCPGGVSHDLFYMAPMAEIIVALDRSTSMNGQFGSWTKSAAAAAALSNAVEAFQDSIRLGYVAFPDPSGCNGMGCCFIEAGIPSQHGYGKFVDDLHACDSPTAGCVSSGERPIGAALAGSLDVFSRLDPFARNRYVLLVTDGQADEEAGCSEGSNDPCRVATWQASALNNQYRARTNVVGLNTSGQDRCLNDIAASGFGSYDIVSPNNLESTIEAIVHEMADDACKIDVERPMDPNHVTLRIGNVEVPRNDADGWDFDGSNLTRITLRPAACDLLLKSDPMRDIQLREECQRP